LDTLVVHLLEIGLKLFAALRAAMENSVMCAMGVRGRSSASISVVDPRSMRPREGSLRMRNISARLADRRDVFIAPTALLEADASDPLRHRDPAKRAPFLLDFG
jgi:hypothetical protein